MSWSHSSSLTRCSFSNQLCQILEHSALESVPLPLSSSFQTLEHCCLIPHSFSFPPSGLKYGQPVSCESLVSVRGVSVSGGGEHGHSAASIRLATPEQLEPSHNLLDANHHKQVREKQTFQLTSITPKRVCYSHSLT